MGSWKAYPRVFPAVYFSSRNRNLPVSGAYWDERAQAFNVFRGETEEAFVGQLVAGAAEQPTESIFATGSAVSTATGANNTCNDPNCAVNGCPGLVTTCTMCNPGYKPLVGTCVQDSLVLQMTFDRASANDALFSQDPKLITGTFVDGNGGIPNTAFLFTPTTVINAAGNLAANISSFKIVFWYKPTAVNGNQTVVTVDGRLVIKFANKDAQTMTLWVEFDGMGFDCYVMTPLKINQWNKIQVEFAGQELATGVGGLTHKRAFQTIGGVPLTLSFKNVLIGATSGGMDGAVDNLQIHSVVISASGGASSILPIPLPSEGWQLPVAIVGGVLALCCIGALVFFMYSRGMCGDKGKGSVDAYHHSSNSQMVQQTGGATQSGIVPVESPPQEQFPSVPAPRPPGGPPSTGGYGAPQRPGAPPRPPQRF